MSATLPMLILSPVVINMGFKGQQKLNTNWVLYIGIILSLITFYLFISGINYILKYLFNDE